jgi:hypothetical protein
MKVTGKITTVLPDKTGVSQSGKQWRRRDYIVLYDESNPSYPKSIVFSAMGDTIDKLNLQQGQSYELDLDFEAREWNGKYFLSASCWRAMPIAATAPTTTVAPAQAPPAVDYSAFMPPPSAPREKTPLPADTDALPF